MFCTYVLQSKMNGELYIGYTANIKRRLTEHNQGLNLSTKRYRPWKLIYCEVCIEKSDATRREGYFKTTQGRRLLKRRLKEYFYNNREKI
ncbi:MAG: GIY-YIG nuclease family protein [bacterium]|nr:GIY-YIG nuclease family protein [bacterium]